MVRLTALADPALAPFAPIYLDLPAGEPGALPQGGETRLSFPNNHLGYAITWYGLACALVGVFAVFATRHPIVPGLGDPSA